MSISPPEPPDFSASFRGYARTQVDEYLESVRDSMDQVEGRARAAESALVQCRRELASSPGTVGISERLAAILQLANDEAGEIRDRARADSDATTQQAANRAERMVDDAHRQRDAIQREIDELSSVRERLLVQLIELGGRIVEATERYQGRPPGGSLPVHEDVELFDAEALDHEVDDEAVTDSDADTQRITSPDETPEAPIVTS